MEIKSMLTELQGFKLSHFGAAFTVWDMEFV